MDASFTGTHTFNGTPTIDLPQAGSGSNPNTVGSETFVTISGGLAGAGGFYVTSTDVMHSWAIPAFGVKNDAIIGRLNQGWFNVRKEGLYYGQCSQICGSGHAYMPIAVRVVSKEAFDKWAASKKKAAALPAPTEFAATDLIRAEPTR